jgi:hypothetical protein
MGSLYAVYAKEAASENLMDSAVDGIMEIMEKLYGKRFLLWQVWPS